jgi:hypothetical protein
MPAALTPQTFVAKWRPIELHERAMAQEHFIDLCRLLDHPTPAEADPSRTWYTFEAGATKATGGQGYADVWKRDFFAWEYKGDHADLDKAYGQLLLYSGALGNPPLLIVCDGQRFRIHTHFTHTVRVTYEFTLDDLLHPAKLDLLRKAFTGPEALRSPVTTAQVTEQAAIHFARIAQILRRYDHPAPAVAHFLIRLLFCLFAEDIGILPPDLFSRLVTRPGQNAITFMAQLRQLFAAMATGGFFGVETIKHVDGGLFNDDSVLPLDSDSLRILAEVCGLNWAGMEPVILGTLFERGLDPDKRSQLGAHFTAKDDILLVVEPVLMAPLRREWAALQAQVRLLADQLGALDEAADAERTAAARTQRRNRRTVLRGKALALLTAFRQKLAGVQILDPACGSGNFLYVALWLLLDLEKAVINLAATLGEPISLPLVSPAQLHGIEVNPYAYELAQTTIRIGYIQWLRDNGFGLPAEPILKPLDTFRQMDAILALTPGPSPTGRGEAGVREPEWPTVDVIVGNPPFLGGKRLRSELGDAYVDAVFALYNDRVPREADLVCYWFERARAQIAAGKAKRAGLLATQSIRGGVNRKVLERIKATGDIFWAWSDRPWILDGAAVRVSLLGFDDGAETTRELDGQAAAKINANLTAELDLTAARRLPENFGLSFMGDTKGGAFDITAEVAAQMLNAPLNPNGRPNSDVVRPWVNGQDITGRSRGMWMIDFGVSMKEADAALYELPFEYVRKHVKPERDKNNRQSYRERWWLHVEPRPDMRSTVIGLPRSIVTPRVAKHRLFVWIGSETLPDSRLYVFARDDDYFFGILHSRIHETWALATSSRHGVGNDPTYNNTTCFDTFPFPWPLGREPADDPRVEAIAQAARELVQLRDAWLNPPGASDVELKKRTLTNLYNARPTWLDNAHKKLDAAVFAAYGWPANPSTGSGQGLTDEEILARLLALNLARTGGK